MRKPVSSPASSTGVEVVSRPGARRYPRERARRAAKRILQLLRLPGAGVTILLTGDAEIRALNLRHRGRDEATDVLSFPSGEKPGRDAYLGDIAISVPAASRQTLSAGWSLSDEVRFLMLHGILHLMGHDHERDGGEMNRLQARTARRLLGREIPAKRRSAGGMS